jgi:predicted AlkP superfamily pyrophosphatase or phosphodiesterase
VRVQLCPASLEVYFLQLFDKGTATARLGRGALNHERSSNKSYISTQTFESTRRPRINMMSRLLRALLLVALLNPGVTGAVPAQAQSTHTKLVLLLVADQFSYNYLNRFGNEFGNGGLRMLQDNGATFTDCRFPQATTDTSVGHSVISTGAYPWASGILADHWYDPNRGKAVSSVADESGFNIKALEGTTIGDQMKLSANNRNKAITVSLKPEATLLLAGHTSNGSFWWDKHTGAFIGSSQVPGWVGGFNSQRFADKFVGKPWQRLLPEAQYAGSERDDYPYERSIPGDGKQFPHSLNGSGDAFYNAFAMTPWSNDMLAEFGKAAIDNESLGQHGDPDLLAISFSAGEELGQAFGPNSHEMQDLCLRLDQSIASLLAHVDQKVGLSNCLVVFTSDHGVSPIPEYLKEKGLEGGRIDPRVFKNLLNSALATKLGPGDWIESFEPPNLYLNASTIQKNKYRQPDVEALAAKLSHSVPGISEAYAAFQFYTNQLPNGSLLEAVRKSYYLGRSGELYIVPKPGFIFDAEITGTQSGSPYNYDCHVPLILMGTSIQGGRYGRRVSPADVSATIAAVLGIDPPSLCEGHVLTECVSTRPSKTALVEDQAPAIMVPQQAQPAQAQQRRKTR